MRYWSVEAQHLVPLAGEVVQKVEASVVRRGPRETTTTLSEKRKRESPTYEGLLRVLVIKIRKIDCFTNMRMTRV